MQCNLIKVLVQLSIPRKMQTLLLRFSQIMLKYVGSRLKKKF